MNPFVFAENKLEANQSGIHIKIHHVQGPNSTLKPNLYSSISDFLLHDEERVKDLNSRVSGSGNSGLSTKSISIPLRSGLSIGTGNYYVKLGLGTPAKYYSMVMDTGSSFSWIQCQPCSVHCYSQVDPLFSPSASKTYKSLSCSTSQCASLKEATLNSPSCTASNKCLYAAGYGDSSYSVGYLSQDSLTLAKSQTFPDFVYGCGQDNDGLFGRAAGILGLARDKLSMLSQVSTKYGYAFSYCLPTAAATATGGFLTIGTRPVLSSLYKFTPMIRNPSNPSLYYLRLTSINVAGTPLKVTAAQYAVPTIIDSGTVITRLPTSLYTALRDAFVNVISKKYAQAPAFSILEACFHGSLNGMSAVPEIRMMFQGGAELSLGASNVLIEAEKGITCLAFAGSSQIAIIGNHQQQTFEVAYDVTNSRIGFAAKACH